jgi:hypothetical protein
MHVQGITVLAHLANVATRKKPSEIAAQSLHARQKSQQRSYVPLSHALAAIQFLLSLHSTAKSHSKPLILRRESKNTRF